MTANASFAERLQRFDTALLDALVASRKEQRHLTERLDRLAAERDKVTAAVYERVHADYSKRVAKLADEAKPLEDRCADARRDAEALLADVHAALIETRLDHEEIELRQRLGEFAEAEYRDRVTAAAELLATREREHGVARELCSRFTSLDGAGPSAPVQPPAPAVAAAPAAVEPPPSPPAAVAPAAPAASEPPASAPSVPTPPTGLSTATPPAAEAKAAAAPAVAKPAMAPPPPPAPAAPAVASIAEEPPAPAVVAAPPPVVVAPPASVAAAAAAAAAGETVAHDSLANPPEPPPAAATPAVDAPAMPRSDATVMLDSSITSGGTTRPFRQAMVVSERPINGRTELPLEPLTTIGRVKQNQIQLDDGAVSRRHAEITLTREGYRLRDLGSGNGTYLNGKAVVDTPLQDGDRILIGGFTLTFRQPPD